MSRLVRVLRECTAAFLKAEPDRPLEAWFNMLDAQLQEARRHLAEGRREKALAEVADLVAVSWEVLARQGHDPEAFIVERVRTRILPRVSEIAETYAANGFKGGETEVERLVRERDALRAALEAAACPWLGYGERCAEDSCSRCRALDAARS